MCHDHSEFVVVVGATSHEYDAGMIVLGFLVAENVTHFMNWTQSDYPVEVRVPRRLCVTVIRTMRCAACLFSSSHLIGMLNESTSRFSVHFC